MIINFRDFEGYYINMEIAENENYCFITPLSPKLDSRESTRIFDILTNVNKNLKIGINLEYTHECSIEFIETIKSFSENRNIGIFNIPPEIFILFNICKLDKITDLYNLQSDFEDKKYKLINRNFSVI